MGWRALLQTADEKLASPWVGGRSLRRGERAWTIDGELPREHGWYTFELRSRTAAVQGPGENPSGLLGHRVRGYLVGDRIVDDHVRVDPDPARIIGCSEPVNLLEPGLDRFARVAAGRMFEGGPLVFDRQEMPLGPEEAVLQAFLDGKESVDDIPAVPPALDAAFRMEAYRRQQARRRREELERLRREEEERRAAEERRRALFEQLGDARGRREMARVDFGEAARAALAVGGAVYLDHRKAYGRNEMVVRFRLNGRRFECTCDARTLRIIDSGICLIDHGTGEKGDDYFTLESLPGVIEQAERERRLVVFRHAGARAE
jgi:hypothetical protein